jgi:hypothetical protein
MKRLLSSVLLLGVSLPAQTPPPPSIQNTLLALKDSNASRKTLSDQLAGQMMAQAKASRPSRYAVERFSEDLTTALIGKDVTAIRASVLQRAISDLMSGKGSNFEPASKLRDTLTNCGISAPTVQSLVGRFLEIGQEVRGPDDLGVLPRNRLK